MQPFLEPSEGYPLAGVQAVEGESQQGRGRLVELDRETGQHSFVWHLSTENLAIEQQASRGQTATTQYQGFPVSSSKN